ncbi:MAG TPA: 1-deoxy-D-xylulose-5-phosphate reductoisomerase [Opitutaceae bacterium]|jgi:1-deoxy-D-xylulose-5-phosphate reductoisomerase
MKRVVLLGATGSIGENTLKVLAAHRDQLRLVGIAARSNADKLAAIAREHSVSHIGVYDEAALKSSRERGCFPPETQLYSGIGGLSDLATLPEADIVLVAVVGTVGLKPTLAALAAGKQVALASKEVLVLAGKFVTAAAKAAGIGIRPVDSEHNAIFQCLQGHGSADVRRILLTASGGAFRDWPRERLVHAQPADALRHPNWAMGPKITVDSATLANKGLELIEAQWLFGLQPEQCDAVVHPQSIVHGLVEFRDGSLLAQLCPPSMTFPIQHALLYPDRHAGAMATLDFTRMLSLEFRPVDSDRFPLLKLAQQAMKTGGCAPAIYNAANEVAVEAFLTGRLPFLAISSVVDHTLSHTRVAEPADLAEVLAADAEARRVAASALPTLAATGS